ncbi:hypothetical protein [Paenibacillus illinoisensis]
MDYTLGLQETFLQAFFIHRPLRPSDLVPLIHLGLVQQAALTG